MESRNGVTSYAPSPKWGNMKRCYDAMLSGPKTSQEIQIATGLSKDKTQYALVNGVSRGYFLKDPHRNRWCIAPLSSYAPMAEKAALRDKKKTQPKTPEDELLALQKKLAKKYGKSTNEVTRLALQYYERNLNKRSTFPKPRQVKAPFWKFWG